MTKTSAAFRSGGRRMTLSFDNGPEPSVTPGVLDVLAAHAAPATFFVIGEKLTDPDRRRLAERAHAEGHRIGNHTWTHTVPLGWAADPAAAAALEIGRTQAELGDLAAPERYFRPTGGGVKDQRLLSPAAVDLLVAGDYTLTLWSLEPRDWENPTTWPELALAQAARYDHSVLLAHDLPTGAMDRLDEFLHRAAAAGFEFVADFPVADTPIRRGERVGDLTPWVTAGAGSARP
jgi:peptidoglycan/xylan/chitin deacetylase (PgdA/CDA1 family)